MPLSKDPEKAQRQLANLAKGRAAAAEKAKSLAVVPYTEPASSPAPEPSHARDSGADEETGGGGFWILLLAGVGLLLVLVLLARRGGDDYEY